jgi:hypothetical protein
MFEVGQELEPVADVDGLPLAGFLVSIDANEASRSRVVFDDRQEVATRNIERRRRESTMRRRRSFGLWGPGLGTLAPRTVASPP